MTEVEIDAPREGKRAWEARLLCALSDHDKLGKIIQAMARPFMDADVHVVACFEALGFPLGAGVATALNTGLLLVRKTREQEAASPDFETESFCDYDGRKKAFKVLKQTVQDGSRILIVDDLLEKGHQLRAGKSLLERLRGKIIGATFISCRVSPDDNLDHRYGFSVHHLNDRPELVP